MSNRELFSQEEQENFNTQFFENDQAHEKANELGFFDCNLLFNALEIIDNAFELKDENNDMKFVSRSGDFKQAIGLALKRSLNTNWQFKNIDGQRCLVSDEEKKIILFASANHALGYSDSQLTTASPKGIKTKDKVHKNYGSYTDKDLFKTWICFYPSRKDIRYLQDDRSQIKIELAFPTSYTIVKESGKDKFLVKNYLIRLILNNQNPNNDFNPKLRKPSPDLTTSSTITEEDLPINLKAG
ncbi:hypothetical protein I6L24_04985 [Acinetobacter lwoffii]|uniref:Uncharacterized protein n=1 Tax=Acinetobacter lwoffii TaxID=28090 RepID=A0AAJ4P3F3_ACILW|nr:MULTISPECIES: hypothetical protein [Acinetobacter]AUC06254.1 hypothetical protein BVG18_04660 [Acinetobacter lwoffii]ENU63955.1 hypothetical protein F980_00422 [Acinetobacter lwoffii NIPH 715]ENX24290.1 hypothetical protein F893_00883 [Acinetobacter sp. CIP 102136]MCO8062849.1 hypothetical protein [Acinetobacter lwoffii]MCO8113906.1 hypothetical protein [Acinetobacter lwoffii]